METTLKIEGKEVIITLTEEQLQSINNQINPKYTVKDIIGIEIAEKILKNTKFHTKYYSNQFVRAKDWTTYQLETIIKAANYLNNDNQEYIPDFDDINTYKYLPYFEKKSSGWFLRGVSCRCVGSVCSVGLYYKVKDTATIIINNNLDLYNQYIKG